ncbi:MAG: hypothetical protein JXA03_08575 [Bacteroidales bacterium]|nr:hypothetical protein [Bacteroidales bacterium]
MKILFSGFFSVLFLLNAQAQKPGLDGITGDESYFYAQTKQVNQFFRRFNGEEDKFGKRYYKGDSLYHDKDFRIMYLNMLFDRNTSSSPDSLRIKFIEYITRDTEPLFLDFHGDCWFAELSSSFRYYGKKEKLLLFLKLEQENLGYKWVLTNVYFDKFLKKFHKGETEVIKRSFLHPLSHELDFMNMHKVFKDPSYTEYFAHNNYKPDYLTLLFYEVKQGNMKFESADNLKFHFFQVDGWYFELSYFNRPDYNSGWLISKLFRINEKEKKELLEFYIP